MNYPGEIKSKLPEVGTTIFTVMSGLANETGAINLSQGFPDFPVSAKLIELVSQSMKKGYNQYAPMPGIQRLRELLCKKAAQLYGIQYDPNTEICITSGATQAIYTAFASFLNPGDEVIIFEPAYDCYVPAIKIHGAIPVAIPLFYPDFKIDWNIVKSKITVNTRAIIINTPHNPSGTILSSEDLIQLSNLVKNTDIIVISDEVYEHIIFDSQKHESVMRYPELSQRSFVIYSFGKTYHATGWKTGYCFAPGNLMQEFKKIHQYNVFCSNTPIQHALADYIETANDFHSLGVMYQQKRNLFLQLIKESGFKIAPSNGSYFQLLDYSEISTEKDTDFAIRVTREFKVASIPVSVFYSGNTDQKLLRFCFAKKDETLEKAAEKILQIR